MDGIYGKIRTAVVKTVDLGAHLNAASVAERIGKTLGLSDALIQFTHIELRNVAHEAAFRKVPYSERMLFLPHCSRNVSKCKAAQDGEGHHCKHCGACSVDKAVKIAEELGYARTFIVPGGSMMKKLMIKYRPKAVVGVSCFHEAILGFDEVKGTNITPQAVLLLNDGCKDTQINISLLREKMSQIDETLIEKVEKETVKRKSKK